MNICPLCKSSDPQEHYQSKTQKYLKCIKCELLYVVQDDLPSFDEEKSIYDLHENNPLDQHYVDFMNRLLIPFEKHIRGVGLDYGCGPGPVVKTILIDHEVEVFEFDPIFKNIELPDIKFDFIVCTEVIEHIYNIKEDFEKILSLLKPLGALGIMTSFYPDDMSKFHGWGYKNDPTHVRLFNEETFHWIAKEYDLEIEVPRKNVVILKRRN